MKRYVSCPGRVAEVVHEHPERTAYKSTGQFGETITFQVWPNRASMARSIRMQQRAAPRSDNWHAVVALRETEGY